MSQAASPPAASEQVLEAARVLVDAMAAAFDGRWRVVSRDDRGTVRHGTRLRDGACIVLTVGPCCYRSLCDASFARGAESLTIDDTAAIAGPLLDRRLTAAAREAERTPARRGARALTPGEFERYHWCHLGPVQGRHSAVVQLTARLRPRERSRRALIMPVLLVASLGLFAFSRLPFASTGWTDELSLAASIITFSDGDSVTTADNCPSVPNDDQADADADGIGDACDPETILPETPIAGEAEATPGCVLVPDMPHPDEDADGTPDACDDDDDNDGIADVDDACPLDAGSEENPAACPTPEETATETPEETGTPTPDATDTPTPEATDTPTPTPEETGTPSPEPTPEPTDEPTDTPSPTPTETATTEPATETAPAMEASPQETDSTTPTPEDTQQVTPEPTASASPSPTEAPE